MIHALWAWLVVALALPSAVMAQDREHVIVLQSHGAENPVHERIVDGIHERLSARPQLRLSIEHLDLHDHGDEQHADALRGIFATKYAGNQPDVLITIGEPALQFALRSRDRLFGGAPIVVGEVDSIEAADLHALPNVTGVLGSHDVTTNIDLMLHLRPQLERVVIVDDLSADAVWLRRDVDLAARSFVDRLEFAPTPNLPISGLEVLLAELGEQDAVFYLHYREDGSGRPVDPLEALGRLSRASGAPVFGAYEANLGYGITGGYLRSSLALGQELANLTKLILEGTPADNLPPHTHTPHHYVFDYRQLARFGLDESILPSPSKVIEEPDTFYYHYRQYFWLAAAIFVALVAYIILLLLNLKRRARVAHGLEQLIAVQNAPNDDLGDGINKAVTDVISTLSAVIPSARAVSAWHYAPIDGAFSRDRLRPVSTPGGPAHHDNAKISPLVERAISTRASTYEGRDAAVLLPNERLPLTLAELSANRRLDEIDRHLLDISARAIAAHHAEREADRTAASLRSASAIQRAMLPTDFGAIADRHRLDLYAALLPAQEIGGDLYDAFELRDGRLCLVVGDVSDKGMPAALLMAITRTAIRAAAEIADTPDAILASANRVIEADNPHAMFVTLFLAIWNSDDGTLDYANAGHNPPFLARDGQAWAELSIETNIALGVLAHASFVTEQVTLMPGDRLFMYTDGVNEALNDNGISFGLDRLTQVLNANSAATPEATIEHAIKALNTFTDGAPRSDDITIMAMNCRA